MIYKEIEKDILTYEELINSNVKILDINNSQVV